MGMIACYQMVDDKIVDELLNQSAEEIFEAVEELQETEEIVLDIDKSKPVELLVRKLSKVSSL